LTREVRARQYQSPLPMAADAHASGVSAQPVPFTAAEDWSDGEVMPASRSRVNRTAPALRKGSKITPCSETVEDVFVAPLDGEVCRTWTFRMKAPAIRGPGWTLLAPITGQDPRRDPEKFLLDPEDW
jgi:hypothetical protein